MVAPLRELARVPTGSSGRSCPKRRIVRSRPLQLVLGSTFLSDGGRDALKYGALIAVTTSSHSTFEPILVTLAQLIPATLLAMWGGAIADAFPKRLALTVVYVLQGAACFVFPIFFGTALAAMIALLFAVSILSEVSTPDESSVAPLVASDEQLATATSLINLASNIGTAVGTALLAPILLRAIGVQAVFYAAGVMLLLAATRIFQVRSPRDIKATGYQRPEVHLRGIVAWLAAEPAVVAMLTVGVMAGTAMVVLQTLAPRYVQTVLNANAAESVYVFAPTSLGLAIALGVSPGLMKRFGERWTALFGFTIISITLFLLGMVPHGLPTIVDPANPFRVLNGMGLGVNQPLRTASLLAIPLGFGVSATSMAVQTYVNRRVPLTQQGRTFALQSTVKNGIAIIPLVTLGALTAAVGVDTVLLITPFLLLALAILLVRLSFRFAGHAPPGELEVLQSFWHDLMRPQMATESAEA